MGYLRKGCHCQNTRRKKLQMYTKSLEPTQKAKVCYARVSSEHQRDDLERQITDLRQRYPGHEIISDIGSGFNWKRRVLEQIYSKGVEEVVVTRKDRLCRNLWSGFLKKMEHGSWFSVQKFIPMIANMDIMDYVRPQIAEGEEKPPKRFKSFKKEVKKLSAGKVRRIRIYPNQQ